MATTSRLQPPAPRGTEAILTAVLSPRASALALVLTPSLSRPIPRPAPKKAKRQQVVYLASLVSKGERRAFVVETYTLFASLQKIAQDTTTDLDELMSIPNAPSSKQVQYFSRMSRLYRQAIVNQLPLIEADVTLTPAAKAHELDQYATMHSVLALAEILYLPADGRGDGVVGEEILDWVNTVDRAPSAEEGAELADLAQPWTHPNFWPYLQRCVLRGHLLSAQALLALLKVHPSSMLQTLGGLVLDLLSSFPRSTGFRVEREYLDSLLRWRARAAQTMEEARDLWEDSDVDELWGESVGDDERPTWEDGFRGLLELLEGGEDAVLEASEDWREAIGAWGLWVKPSGRRENLPYTLASILHHHPMDGTLQSEAIQVALLKNDVTLALQQANQVSCWLVAHLADLFAKLAILPTPSLRDYFLLSYADVLMGDPGLWRVVVDYLVTAGSVGRARAELVLESVSLEDAPEPSLSEEGSGKENEQPAEKVRVVEEVLRVCAENGMHEQTRSICKVFSEILVEQKRYGEAVSFCIRAGEPKRIARIADSILDEYVVNGQEAFVRHVDSIPTSLLRPPGRPASRVDDSDFELEDPEDEPSPPHPRLSFLARYRDFFALYARGELRQATALLVLLLTSDIAPKRFYAVMFLDVIPLLQGPDMLITLEETYELLRCLEEVTAPISATGRDVYGHLLALGRIVGGTASDAEAIVTERAMKQLDLLRGALAIHLGRCFCN